MNVMNIKHLFLAAATLGVFAACSDYDPGMSEDVIDYTDEELATIQEYTANFIERYGEIDPNHTWGFGEIGSEDELIQTRIMNVNSNMWAVPNSDFPLSNIPGYPQATDDSQYSGKYFVQKDGDQYKILDTVVAGETGYNPAGDVTDEEIAYVSAWFRTHYKPKGISINYDSYYVQAISGDKDRTYYGSMENEGTDNWREVRDYNKYANTDSTAACGHWVTKTDIYYTNTQNGTINSIIGQEDILYTVDHLDAPSSSTGPANDHVLNFNWQRTNKIDQLDPTNPESFYQDYNYGAKTGNARTITYVYNSNTQDFAIRNSNTDIRYNKYVVVHLDFVIGGKSYSGDYVAFDYEFYHDQIPEHSWTDGDNTYTEHKYTKRAYDGYYSNYIVKIVPGEGKPQNVPQYPKRWYRIMCEDLGNTYDYDFNDLVYDVYFTGTAENTYTAHIKLQAAGGTYPIYLGTHPTEIHEVLGGTVLPSGLYQPINVGGKTGSAEEFTITGLTSTDPNNIDINIHTPKTGNSRTNNDFTLPRAGEIKNSAPQKICIPGNTTKWTKENQQIEWAYPHFAEWVGKQWGQYRFADWQAIYNGAGSLVGWNLVPGIYNDNGTNITVTPWNTTDVVSSFLYQ